MEDPDKRKTFKAIGKYTYKRYLQNTQGTQ